MKRTFTSALQFVGVSLFAATSLLAPGATASASPMEELVDCTDSFWTVVCGMEAAEPRNVIVIPEGETRIDNDMICTVETDTLRICHT